MKSLSLILFCSLLTTPLHTGTPNTNNTNTAARSSSGSNNSGAVMIAVFCVGFALVKAYEWYTEPKTDTPEQNIKTNTEKMPTEIKDIPERISSVRSLDLLIEKNPSQPPTAAHKEPFIPTGPILPPPPLTQLPFPEEKPIMTSAAKASALKTTAQNSTKRNNTTAVKANDPFN